MVSGRVVRSWCKENHLEREREGLSGNPEHLVPTLKGERWCSRVCEARHAGQPLGHGSGHHTKSQPGKWHEQELTFIPRARWFVEVAMVLLRARE